MEIDIRRDNNGEIMSIRWADGKEEGGTVTEMDRSGCIIYCPENHLESVRVAHNAVDDLIEALHEYKRIQARKQNTWRSVAGIFKDMGINQGSNNA